MLVGLVKFLKIKSPGDTEGVNVELPPHCITGSPVVGVVELCKGPSKPNSNPLPALCALKPVTVCATPFTRPKLCHWSRAENPKILVAVAGSGEFSNWVTSPGLKRKASVVPIGAGAVGLIVVLIVPLIGIYV